MGKIRTTTRDKTDDNGQKTHTASPRLLTATLLSELLVALSFIDGLNIEGVLVLISIEVALLSSTETGFFSSTNIPESIQKIIGITM